MTSKDKFQLKKALPDIVAIVAFVVISFAYFFPADTEGRILAQHDAVAGIGAGRELTEYYERTGESTRWTNALFSGMPTYQMAPGYKSCKTLNFVEKIYRLFLPTYVWYVFVMLLGFYILLRAFNFKVWISALGAIIWAFSSYFFIIIAAGHIWKFVTLAYIPPTIAGMVLIYRKKYWVGGLVTALFVGLQILSNHLQMTYYFLFVMLFLVIAFGVKAYKENEMQHFVKATAVLVVAGILGICLNLSNLYHTYQYSKETMRGKSELVKKNPSDQTDGGLERSYITQWSYGVGETFSLLVPNVKGGASVPLIKNEEAVSKANPLYAGIYQQLGQYWGEQPGTSGPVYVGAFVMFLFILGCFIVKGPLKWALIVGTLFSIMLSWGKNFMPLTDFFIDYVPMYNKFRAVSSILVIAEFTIPLLAVMALNEVIQRPQIMKEKALAFIVSLLLTAGIALLFAITPSTFFSSFVSSMEMNAFKSGIPEEHLTPLIMNLTEMRQAIFTADARRSFIVIMIGAALLYAYYKGKAKATLTVAALALLCLVDLWGVNKRYLYDDQFVDADARMKPYLQPSDTDKAILADPDLSYRVLDMSKNTFNDNSTSYWHKSIGGYHAAKLRRYQELIEEHINGEMNVISDELPAAGGDMTQIDRLKLNALSMLNARYFILPLQGGSTIPIRNPYSLGNAWFVDEVMTVDNANEEIEALHYIDPAVTAVVDKTFADVVGGQPAADSAAVVTLTDYEPNALKYKASSEKGGTVVFSEIYYPGWESYIDGVKTKHGRADYVLRAMNVPAGNHEIEFVFDPKSIQVTEAISYVAIGILILGTIAFFVVKKRRGHAV